MTLLIGPEDFAFPNPFTPTDFEAARAGPNAKICLPNPTWLPSHSSDPTARWINSDGGSIDGNTVLCAIEFILSEPFDSATIQVFYLVDDYLGANPSPAPEDDRAGVYVNEIPVPGTSGIGGFLTEFEFSADITEFLTLGHNYLYLYDNDAVGGDTGVLFSAHITTSRSPTGVPIAGNQRGSWGDIKAWFRQ